MEKMKRVLALLLVFAMLMPNMTTIALAADTEEDSVEISTEPVVVMEEEPEETEATEAATEAPTESPTEATEAPVVETEPVVVETEPPVTEETTVATVETVEGSAVEEVGTVTETVTVTSQQDAVAEQTQHPVTAESCVEVIPDFGEDFENDFLFAMYVEDQFLDNIPAKFGTAGRERLSSEAAKYVYDEMKAQIELIAAGEVTSTVIAIDNIADRFRFAWTKEELGVSVLVSNGAFTQEAQNALIEVMGAELDRIMDALLVDCPYDLYWYDKTIGVRAPFGISSTDGITVSIPSLTVSMPVVSGYQGGSQHTTTKELSKVKTAADNANMVVSQHRSKNFYEKLTAYKDYICNQVAYNEAAAKPYGDPWQVIYVFDGNSTTNVVCEGYAKAFQYLCDLSDFENNTVESFLVSGYAGGPHMWNIVSIDGRNYMVDVTNSDPHEDPNWLRFGQDGSVFLAGAPGSIADGYTFKTTLPGFEPLTYQYSYTDDGETIQDSIEVYGDDKDSILNLSDISYAEYLEQQEQEEQPEQPEQPEEKDPYISLRRLDNWGNGWFEDLNGYTVDSIHLYPNEYFYMIAYLNQWNEGDQGWDMTPIHASKLVVDENLILEPFRNITDGSNRTEENQNFDCFFRVHVADGTQMKETSIIYSNTEIQIPVELGRNAAGFYSADPTAAGADPDELWLNDFRITGENRTFYFYFDPALYRDGTWMITEVNPLNSQYATVTKVKDGLWEITISQEYAQSIYDRHEFALELEVWYSNGETGYEGYPGLTCRAPDFGEPNASFEINGQQYHASWNYDGLFTFKRENGEEYPVPADIEGVSYDIHSNTLTLNNAHLETLRIDHHWRDEQNGNEGWNLPDSRFNIKLVDSNSITANNDHAIVISNDVHLTILGDGSLTVSTYGDENNNCHSAFEVNESDVTIAGNAKVTVSISGENNYEHDGVMYRGNMNAIWGYGNGRWLHLRDNATLTTQVPEGTCINGYFDKDGRFVEEGSYSGIVFFNIEVNDNATLNTQTIRVWDEGRGNAYGAYYQNGGTVNISGIPYYNYFEEADENGNHEHYHFNGIEASYGQIDINGGVLNISMTATEAQLAKSTYYHGIQSRGRHIGLNGGVINVSGNFSGTGIKVGEDNWDGGTNAWADFNNSTLNMGGSDLYRCAIDVATNGSINFNGGVINAKPADIQIRGDAQWNGTQAYLEGCGIHIQGDAQLNDGFISVKDGFFRVHQGGSLTKNAC